MLALLVAVCFGVAWVLRLGWIADYFSRPVLIGYIHGVAVILVIGQLGKLLGLSIDARDPLPQLWEVIQRARRRQRRRRSRRRRVALGVAARACGFVPQAAGGADRRRRVDRRLVGARPRRRTASPSSATIPSGLPSFDAADARRSATSSQLAPAALGIFLVSFADEILTARSFAGKHNQHVRASQELLAMGAANAAAGLHAGVLDRRQRLAHRGQRLAWARAARSPGCSRPPRSS